jgi:glycosyltransferase involved in cell wall biosynthesis
MQKSELISVIIPTFNRSHLIGESIDSVLRQDVKGYDVEVLVIDDGSTDNTKENLKDYINKNKIRYIYQDNRGAGAARNHGIEEARGDWITFLDSDDRWLPYQLSIQTSVIEKIPYCKVLFSDFLIVAKNEKFEGRGLDYWALNFNGSGDGKWKNIFSDKIDSGSINLSHRGETFQIYNGNIFDKILFQPCMPCWTTIISRECLADNVRFAENFPTWEDFWFSCRLAEKNEIYFMDVITAENRGHSGPRLTQADIIKRTKCYIDICSGIYLRSASPYRPSDVELIGLYTSLNKILFKEYVKNGMHLEADEVKSKLDKLNIDPRDLSFLLYYIGSTIPGKPINKLVRLKRFFNRL